MKLTQNRFIRPGLRFECRGCGGCCRARGNVVHVFLAAADIKAMASYLRLSPDEFLQTHCEIDRTEGLPVLKGQSGDCRFLDERGACTVYPVRPAQCVAWPFWIENLNPESWARDVVPVCPGAGYGKLRSAEEIDRIATAREDAFDNDILETLNVKD